MAIALEARYLKAAACLLNDAEALPISCSPPMGSWHGVQQASSGRCHAMANLRPVTALEWLRHQFRPQKIGPQIIQVRPQLPVLGCAKHLNGSQPTLQEGQL